MSKIIVTTAEELKEIIQEAVNKEVRKVFDEIKPDDLIDINQVAKLFDVSKKTIHGWKRKDLIKFHKIGGKLRFKHSEIMEALNSFQKYSHYKTHKIDTHEKL